VKHDSCELRKGNGYATQKPYDMKNARYKARAMNELVINARGEKGD